MSSGITPPPTTTSIEPGPNTQYAVAPSPFERQIDERIQQTRRQVQGVDLTVGLLLFSAVVGGVLCVGALLDHWVFDGGLDFVGRLLLWFAMLASTAYIVVTKIWPAVSYRIHPLYAADTLERNRPTLKNGLINLILLRNRRQEIGPVIYHAMERSAASELAQLRAEGIVDRHGVLVLSYIFAGIVIFASLYFVFSPKSLAVSATRVLWPWSRLHAPTRVTIEDIRPGDIEAYHDDSLDVSAEVKGLQEGEQVLLHYSTTDGQVVDQTVPMSQPKGEYRRSAKLPPGNLGLQQDLKYFLTAGDYRSDVFHVDVRIPPTITVDKIEYRYPSYTGLPTRTVQREGDIRAIEGTEIILTAQANMPIARAEIAFEGSAKRVLPMTAHEREALGRFTLRLDPKTRRNRNSMHIDFAFRSERSRESSADAASG